MMEWVDRNAALAALNVRPQTLYAYVSRGRIGMRPDPDDPRRSLYRADDIATLRERRARGRRPAAIAASAIAWGEPSIETAISTVRRGRLIYRGMEATRLAIEGTAEEVAALLWQRETVAFPAIDANFPASAFEALAGLVEKHGSMLGRSPERWASESALCVSVLAQSLGAEPGTGALHDRIACGWRVSSTAAATIRKALVLLADHELNASTFACRVAASTGASVPASLLSGLCALSGPRHGGAGEALLELIDSAEQIGPEDAIAKWSRSRIGLPGFGHPLYPGGDPRATSLLTDEEIDPALQGLSEVAEAVTGRLPNIDFALAAISRRHQLPRQAPFRLFAIGRSIGWAAHAMEQASTGSLIRPRARYSAEEEADN